MNPAVVCLLCFVVLYFAKYAQLWLARIRLGLPGPPPPPPYVGDICAILTRGQRIHLDQLELLKKYGRVVATTEFGVVHILISDPKVIKAVTIEKADYFTGVEVPGFKITKPPYNSMITIAGSRWRRIRSTISPIFTTSMLKHMMILMKQAVDTLVRKIETAAKEEIMVDAHEYVQQATMEIVLKTSFGIDANCQVNKEDPFIKHAEKAFASTTLIKILGSLPFAAQIASLMADPCDLDLLLSTARQIIKQRRQGIGENNRDFVQLLLNTQKDESEERRLTENEILAQSLIFLLSGFDATSSAVAHLIYLLALHPKVQENVREEIDKVWPDEKQQLTYEMIQEMSYLDMCLQESQRLFSVSYLTTRLCAEDCDIEGIQFKKGMVAVLPIYATHRLPEVWPEPNKFIPERFTPEAKAKRSPYVYMPFGHGARNCVGVRFAALNVKLIVVAILKRFMVEKTDKTLDPMACLSTLIINLPKGSTTVKFLPRIAERSQN